VAYDDTLIVDHLNKTHDTNLLSEREKHLVGLRQQRSAHTAYRRYRQEWDSVHSRLCDCALV
jgi:hypothetical protein